MITKFTLKYRGLFPSGINFPVKDAGVEMEYKKVEGFSYNAIKNIWTLKQEDFVARSTGVSTLEIEAETKEAIFQATQTVKRFCERKPGEYELIRPWCMR